MHHVRQQLPVHLFHLRPIRAVHVLHVKIVALIAPAFVEDLFELFLRLEIHAQREVQTSRARLWRCAIGIDEEQLRRRSIAGTATWTTALTTTTGRRTIDQLATIGADFISSNIARERRRTAIAETITPQFIAGARTARTGVRSRFEETHLAVD